MPALFGELPVGKEKKDAEILILLKSMTKH
jgi:hypothetical protein